VRLRNERAGEIRGRERPRRKGAPIRSSSISAVAAVHVAHVVDTVGAGDGFVVGVISALLDGHDVRTAVARGNRIGAMAIQVIRDMEGLPTRRELEAAEGR
jgi:2-dehydro-3-deoxygluconokinase